MRSGPHAQACEWGTWIRWGWALRITELRSIFRGRGGRGTFCLVLLVRCIISDGFFHGTQAWDQTTKGTPRYRRQLNLPAGWPKMSEGGRPARLQRGQPSPEVGFRPSEVIAFNTEKIWAQGRDVLTCRGASYMGWTAALRDPSAKATLT